MKNLAGEEMPKITIETRHGKTTHEFNFCDPTIEDYLFAFIGLLAAQGWDSTTVKEEIKSILEAEGAGTDAETND